MYIMHFDMSYRPIDKIAHTQPDLVPTYALTKHANMQVARPVEANHAAARRASPFAVGTLANPRIC